MSKTAIDRSALRFALYYALFGIAWIVVSDDLILAAAPDIKILAQLGMWKGLAFVTITAAVIYLVAARRPTCREVGDEVEVARGAWPLILIFILLASIVVAVGLLGVAHNVGQQKAGMFARLHAIADLKIGQVQAWLAERKGDAEVLGGATVFKVAYGTPGQAPDEAGRRDIEARMDAYIRAYDFQSIFLVDAYGAVQLAAGDAPGAPGETLKAVIRRAIDTGKVQYTDLYRLPDPGGEQVAMDFVAPVRGATGRSLAVVMRVDPRRFLYPLIQSWPVPSDTAETLLFRPDADRVLFLNDLRHRSDTALKLSLPLTERQLLAVKVLNGEANAAGEVEGVDYRKTPVVGVVKAVPGTSWYMVAKIDKDELYAQGGREAGWIILADTLVLIIAAAASILVHQRREMRLTLARQLDQEEKLHTLGLLNAIADGSSDVIFAKDVANRYIFVNRAATELLGLGMERILGQDDLALYPPDVARGAQALDREVMASGRARSYESSYPMPGGERTFLMTKGPLRGADGRVTGIFGVARDITERKRAEAALVESEHRFATVFRASPSGIALCGLDDGRFLDVNDTFLDLFGLAREAVVGHSGQELDLWAEPDGHDRVMSALTERGQVRNLELKFRHASGRLGDALVSGEAVELGGQGYLLAMIADITDLRLAERQAKQGDALLNSVFQTLPDLFFLMDGDGTIRDYRARADTDLYAPPEVFLGKRMQDMLPPELGGQFVDHMRTVHDQGDLVRFEYDLDIPNRGPRRFEARLAMPEGSGQFIAVVRDITREHHDREALAESEERFVRALENIPDVVVIYDRDLRIRYINGATLRLTGRPVADFIGRRDDEIWPPEVFQAYAPALEQALATATVSTVEVDLELATGARSLQIACVPLLDGHGEVHEVMGVTHDLTERKRAEQEILQFNAELEQRVRERTAQVVAANKELETFAYSVSHDLKAPLRGIDGYSRLLLEECAPGLNRDCHLFVDNIRAGAEQMRRLIDDLLAYSRMERRALQDYPVAVADAVRSVLAERADEIARRGAQVHLALPDGTVRADPDGLLFVLRNLVDNALKFTRDAQPPVLEIGGGVEGEGASARQVLWIKDNGIGFDMKFHDRIFEIFQRLQRAEDYPGTGVGLAIVHKAMLRMKGRVWAESAPGQGATFFLELPA